MLPDFAPADTQQARQHLATLLLAKAVQITYAVDQMEKLATSNSSDPSAAAQLTDAITIMATVRTTLIHHADQLNEPPLQEHSPATGGMGGSRPAL